MEFRERLRTVHVVPMTAYDEGGELALDPVRDLIRRLHTAGVRAFIPGAGSAEFNSLVGSEIARLVAVTREATDDSALILAPIGGPVTGAIETGKRSVEAGADGVIVMPLESPYLCDEGAERYYRAVFDELDCPVLIYKKAACPSDNLLLSLAGHRSFVGVKYAINDINAFARLVGDDAGRLEWICGSAERFAPFFMLAGASAFTSGAANVCPRLSLALFDQLSRGQFTEAMQSLATLRPIEDYRARGGNSYNVSFLKQALRVTGLDMGPPRPPNRLLTAAEEAEIADLLSPILDVEARLGE